MIHSNDDFEILSIMIGHNWQMVAKSNRYFSRKKPQYGIKLDQIALNKYNFIIHDPL